LDHHQSTLLALDRHFVWYEKPTCFALSCAKLDHFYSFTTLPPNDSSLCKPRIAFDMVKSAICLVQSLWWRHGSLDGKTANVLPSLLQQRDQVVDGKHNVGNELILGHSNIAHSDTHAKHLLELKLDGGLDINGLVVEIFIVRNWCWELSSLGKTGSQETRNLLDESLGGQESIILAGKFLDELLVLVQLLQIIRRHSINTQMLSSIQIVLIAENANAHAWSWDCWKLDGSRETLVTLRIVVLEANLELHSLQEVALLGSEGVLQEILDIGTDAGD